MLSVYRSFEELKIHRNETFSNGDGKRAYFRWPLAHMNVLCPIVHSCWRRFGLSTLLSDRDGHFFCSHICLEVLGTIFRKGGSRKYRGSEGRSAGNGYRHCMLRIVLCNCLCLVPVVIIQVCDTVTVELRGVHIIIYHKQTIKFCVSISQHELLLLCVPQRGERQRVNEEHLGRPNVRRRQKSHAQAVRASHSRLLQFVEG